MPVEIYKDKKLEEHEQDDYEGILGYFRIDKGAKANLAQEIIEKLDSFLAQEPILKGDMLDLIQFLSLRAVENQELHSSKWRFFEHGSLGDLISNTIKKVNEDYDRALNDEQQDLSPPNTPKLGPVS